jgi:hypothetical protein
MLQIPKRLTNSIDGKSVNRLHNTVIINSENLSNEFKLISFRNAQCNDQLLPGKELSIHINDNHFQAHTLTSVDRIQRLYCILLHLNNNTISLNTLQPGDNLQFTIEPEKLVYNSKASHHFFFGDESAIGLFNAYKEIALQSNHEYFGVVELSDHNEHILNRLKILIESVPPSPGQGAQNAIHWMEDMHPNCWKAWQNATFYLAGPQELIAPFREYLLQKGVSASQIRITN